MKITLKILAFFILLSCSRKEPDPIPVIDLLSTAESEIVNLSEIATDVEFIPLQTIDSSLISYIYQIKSVDGKIYLDGSRESQILCFDKSGRYLYKLQKGGRGPEEYTFLLDWDISSDGELLIVYSTNKILVYNDTGSGFTFQKSLNLKNQPSKVNFIPDQKNILLSYSFSEGIDIFQNIVINLNGDTLSKRPNFYKFELMPNGTVLFGIYENLIYELNGSLKFKGRLSDTIFTIGPNYDISPYLILNSGGEQVTMEDLANIPKTSMSETRNAVEKILALVSIIDILEVPRYIIYKMGYKNVTYYEVYDKKLNSKHKVNNVTFINDDIAGGGGFEPRFSSDNKLYSWTEALTIKNYVSSEDFKNSVVKDPQKKKALETMANSLKDTDNPVLVVVTLKE